MKLTVATSFPAPERWAADQPEPKLPEDDIVYRITKKGRAHMEAMTSREAREKFTFETREEWNARTKRADALLRPMLKPGDRIRARKAECCAGEATFTFDSWHGGWIQSLSGRDISPGEVYSVNGQVIRA